MSKKYTQLAEDIIKNVGGKDNVRDVRHCVTRLRFHLKDETKADDAAVKSMKGVAALVKAAGEYMVVIGEHVPDVYEEVCKVLGIPGESEARQQENTEKKGFLDSALGLVMAAMGPTLNLLSACGIIKGVSFLLVVFGLPMDGGVYQLLSAAGDAIFYGMPVFMGFNIAKHLGIDPFFGFLFGAALTYPAIQGVDLDLFGFTVNATYTSTFLPVLFGLLLATPIYKFLKERIPAAVNGFLTPLITLLIAFPITFAVIGPLANIIGNGISVALDYLFDKVPVFGSLFVGAIWTILVMFGVHGIPTMFAFYALLAGTPSSLLASVGGATYGIVGIMIGVILKSRNRETKRIASPMLASSVMGVTEPALYGFIVPRKVLLAVACLAGAFGGLMAGLFKMKVYTYTGIGITGLLGLINPNGAVASDFIGIALQTFGSMAIGLLLTLVLYKEGDNARTVKANDASEIKGEVVKSPVTGEARDITESTDAAFSSEALGKGVVVFPENGEVYAPVSGEVKTVFPTGHAVGIVTDDGCEVLLHLGVDTVNLQGKHFTAHVKQGERVNQGDKLVSFDKEAIEKEGYSTEVLMVITNTADYLDVIQLKAGKVAANEDIVRAIR